MKKFFSYIIIAGLVLSAMPAQAQTITDTPGCQQAYGQNFVYDTSSNTCKDKNYVSTSGTGGTNYTCPSGQTWSSTGNNGAGGCVTSPSTTNPATTDYNCPTGQTWSSTGNYGAGGCVADPSAQSTTGSGGSSGSTYTPPAAATTNTSSGNGKLTYTPLEPLPGGNDTSYNSISRYLNLMFNILLSIGAMIAVVTLVLGGVTFMVSEVAEKRNVARARIRAAFIGLGLLLTCWLILYTINPNLTKFYLPGIDQSGVTNGSGSTSSASPTTASTIDVAQINQQQTACKAKGPSWAFYVGQGGQTYCTDVNQI